MEKLKINFVRTIHWITDRRNLIFMIACLVIHATYAYVFYSLGIQFLTGLNIFSCCFYFFYLFIKRDTSEKSMMATFFEILFFSVMSELALGPDYGFYLYIIGMSATVFYMLPSYVHKRFLFQFIGIALVLVLEAAIIFQEIRFEEVQRMARAHQPMIFLANIGITASIVLAAAFFYSKEIESVWDTLKYNMNHDTLTNLYNRRFFEDKIKRIPERKRKEFVVCMLDIDFFKKVNDTYGHKAGDEVLVHVSSCIQETAGEENLAVRWGGEEFILYFPNGKREQVYREIERLRRRIEEMVVKTEGQEIQVTITAGIASGVPDSNCENVIKSADKKLYIGKKQGRNRVIL